MGTISRYNSVQFENLNANELVGVTLVYKSVNRDGETHYSGLNFAGDEYTPKDKTQDEIFRVWKNVVATFWTVKAVEAGLREDNGGIDFKKKIHAATKASFDALKFRLNFEEVAAKAADYYEILGVKHDATEAEIKAAYKQAAKSAHPDAGGSNEKMQEVNAAWEVLGNAQKRAEYDARMAA